MFYAIVDRGDGFLAALAVAESMRELLDSIEGSVAEGNEIIIAQRVKVLTPVKETIWKEVK